MSEPQKNLTKKLFGQLKEVEFFYKVIHKYKLREDAYKALLKSYIKDKRAPKQP